MDYHGDLYLYNVCLGSNKNILLLLLLHRVPTAVPVVILRCLYVNGVPTEVALRCLHGATAGIFCSINQTCHLVRIVRIQYGFLPFLR